MLSTILSYISLAFTTVSLILYSIFIINYNKYQKKVLIYKQYANIFISLSIGIQLGLVIHRAFATQEHITIPQALQLAILLPITLMEIYVT